MRRPLLALLALALLALLCASHAQAERSSSSSSFDDDDEQAITNLIDAVPQAAAVPAAAAPAVAVVPAAPAPTPVAAAPAAPAAPAADTCGSCTNGRCVKDTASGLRVCQCSTGFWGSACQFGPGGGGVCAFTATSSASTVTALQRNTWFKKAGWTNVNQTAPALPCGKHGACTDGYCVCTGKYIGAFCQRAPCLNDCSEAGYCTYPKPLKEPVCKCLYGTSGEDCSIGSCLKCSGHGTCHASAAGDKLMCKCHPGFTGEHCETRACPSCVNGGCDPTSFQCKCHKGFTGADCSERKCPKNCSGHGTCDKKTGQCKCSAAFTGKACNIDATLCPNNCSGAGTCTANGCVCKSGAQGLDCSKPSCPKDCSGHGECQKDGTCKCEEAFKGKACNKPACGKSNCNGNGLCRKGKCMCAQPFTGKDCSEIACPNQCSGNGVCDPRTGICSCYDAKALAALFPEDGPDHEFGFAGKDCSLKQCFSDCGVSEGKGTCNTTTGACECAKGFWGAEGMHCNSVLCADKCSDHGFCVDDRCVCDVAANKKSGWTGDKCEKPVCPNHCFESAGLGSCVNGACQCAPDWFGEDCSQKRCPANYSPLAWIGAEKTMCSGHGTCNNGVCTCAPGFSGLDCSVRACPGITINGTESSLSCSGHGTCQPNGACVCDAGFRGVDCFERKCASDCGQRRGRGVCDGETGRCECKPGWFGADCSHRKCDQSCNGHGTCLDDECACDPGFQGLHCETPVCGNNCSFAEGQGQCVNGQCKCNPGFNGVECLYKDCPSVRPPLELSWENVKNQTCAGNGVCVAGKCECNAAWTGVDCTTRTCPHNCSDIGVCNADGFCECPVGDKDGRGGATGKFCEQKLCPGNCGEDKKQGKCVKGQCQCVAPFAAPDCLYNQCPLGMPPLATPFSVPVPCSGTGSCVKGACKCLPGFTGPNCAHRECLNNCGGAAQGTCLPNGQCVCTDKFMGADCSVKACPEGCSGHGACVGHGKCKCDSKWTGARCEIVKCPNGCSSAGECVRIPGNATQPAMERCECDPGFRGDDCSEPVCLPIDDLGVMCKGKGHCVIDKGGRHVCRCDPPFVGADCGNTACNKTCNFHGSCNAQGQCECDAGWAGADCERMGECMPFDCFGRGTCVAGPKNAPICKCNAPFGGPDCSLCMHNCTGHGVCSPNGCQCAEGWHGELCDRREDCDPKDCGGKGHGTCVADANGQPVCKCNFPWKDFDCMECTLTCNDHGSCNAAGGCTCDKGWAGEFCDRFGECPNKCSNKGTCVGDDIGDPVCKCLPGYGGLDCGGIVCNSTCPAHSQCLDGECQCMPGWIGDACDERDDCVASCHDRGVCMADLAGKPFCKCAKGWGGESCEHRLCDLACSDHGSCFMIKGQPQCKCDAGWGGKDCGQVTCASMNFCGGSTHGECGLDVQGNPKCICEDPYTGPACADVKCTKQHCIHGTCSNEKCKCDAGWKGEQCDYRVPCPAPGCGEGGRCVGDEKGEGKCLCDEGLTGPTCQDVICDDKCSGHGKCLNLACQCDSGFHGAHCEITAPCPQGCNGHGECNYDAKNKRSVCDCEDMWDSAPGKGDCSVARGSTWMDFDGRVQYKCTEPYYGNLCQKKRCEKPCQHGGICADDGLCDCPAGWTGADCSEPVCPLGCNGGGECDLLSKECRCFYGYSGRGCENYSKEVCVSTCEFKCSLKGATGLVAVYEAEAADGSAISWVGAKQCHEMCSKDNLCMVLFGTGHKADGKEYARLT